MAQDRISLYPVQYMQGYQAYRHANPAAACSYSNSEWLVGNQHVLGNMRKIASYYASGYVRLSNSQRNRKPFSTIGVSVFNDQEGKYINRSRIYANYAWHAHAFNRLKISGGFNIGAVNYHVKGTPLSGDGSDIKPDASVGFQLYTNEIFFGTSVNQLLNSELQPLQQITRLNPHLNFCLGGSYNPSAAVSLKPIVLVTIPLYMEYTGNTKPSISAYLRADYRHWLDVGIGLYTSRRMVAEVGLPITVLSRKMVEFHMSYTVLNLATSSINTPLLELSFNFTTPD